MFFFMKSRLTCVFLNETEKCLSIVFARGKAWSEHRKERVKQLAYLSWKFVANINTDINNVLKHSNLLVDSQRFDCACSRKLLSSL